MKLKLLEYDVTAFNWVPLFSFSFVLFFASIAIVFIPYTIIAETIPVPVKAFGISFSICFLWAAAFFTVKILPFLNENLGMDGSSFLFAGVCVFGALFFIFYVPETKDKSYEEIMISLQ